MGLVVPAAEILAGVPTSLRGRPIVKAAPAPAVPRVVKATGHRPPATGHRPPATGHRPPATETVSPGARTGAPPAPKGPQMPDLTLAPAALSPMAALLDPSKRFVPEQLVPVANPAADDVETLTIEALLDKAVGSELQRTRIIGIRVRETIADLRIRLAEEAKTTRAEQYVAVLRKHLDKAEAELRQLRGGKTTAGPAVAGRRQDSRQIRAWAKAAGVECNPTGRVPNAIAAAYDAAHHVNGST